MREVLKARLSPFRHRDFRNYFLAQTLSLVGAWSHDLARAWIIVEATGSSGALGNLNLAIALPCMFLILQGGVFVDRTDVRQLIKWTKSLMGISSLVLAALTEFSHLEIWHLLVFGVIEGIIVAYDSPAFQTLTVRMVPRADFQQAIALNSINFHTSRMLGPILAAWLLALYGPSLVFLFDGLTYFVVAAVLMRTKLLDLPVARTAAAGRDGLKEGLLYIYRNRVLRYRVLQLMLTICCVYPMMVAIFRVYIQRKFNLQAAEFGTVFSFPALGSMLGALSFAALQPREPSRALMIGVPVLFTMLLALPLADTLPASVAIMSVAGFSLYLCFASLTVSMQLDVAEEYRGRLSSVIGLGFSSIGPLMCFPWGHLSDHIGAPYAILCCSLVFGFFSAVLAIRDRNTSAKHSRPSL